MTLVWNVRGVEAKSFPLLVRDLVSKYKVKFFVVLEPQINGGVAKRVIH